MLSQGKHHLWQSMWVNNMSPKVWILCGLDELYFDLLRMGLLDHTVWLAVLFHGKNMYFFLSGLTCLLWQCAKHGFVRHRQGKLFIGTSHTALLEEAQILHSAICKTYCSYYRLRRFCPLHVRLALLQLRCAEQWDWGWRTLGPHGNKTSVGDVG